MALVGEPSSQESGLLQSRCEAGESDGSNLVPSPRKSLSVFEIIISFHQPILESLLLQLPTSAILDLYHTSQYLQSFFQACPLAWNSLSFRKLPSNVSAAQRQQSPASDSSGETSTRRSKSYALDQLLNSVVLPFGLSLRCLCLDQTAVSGLTLTSSILPARRETLQHLSIRGCKNVSLKYHIVPYLNLFKLQRSLEVPTSIRTHRLALKSLYTFRCAHHRRRPYLTSSLRRADSDAKATHEFISLCHSLGIWIDTGWCPTPGGRCSRRKQYFNGRGSSDLQSEVWVVFDRLWRSRNQIGTLKQEETSMMKLPGQLWKDEEYGYNGEALGTDNASCASHSKLTPAHLRHSHRIFVENFLCQTCGDRIPERCEQCSIKMHCIGCRKTWCASCAYTKALPALRNPADRPISGEQDEYSSESFWWAPKTRRSPNLMNQEIAEGGSTAADAAVIPPRQTSWCCISPQFSAGGQITLSRQNTILEHDYICTAPLPPGRGFEDPEFVHVPNFGKEDGYSRGLRKSMPQHYDPMLYWLLYGPGYGPLSHCPRNLCIDCRQTRGWKAVCRACQEPVCLAHDIRGLQARICGYRDLHVEDTIIKEQMLQAAQEALRRKHTQIGAMDRIKSHLQKHGAFNTEYEYELAIITELPDGDDDDLQEHFDEEVDCLPRSSTNDDGMPTNAFAILPFQPQPFNHSNGPLNTSNIWRGCSTFNCQEFRPLDDHRRPCPASMKKCTECGVNVCFECSAKQELCECSYCSDNYRCLNCMPNFDFENCKKIEELTREGEEEVDENLHE